MDKKKTTGEKILDFLEEHSPEKLDERFSRWLQNLSEESAKEPLTERQKEFLAESEPRIIALVVFGFAYIMYLFFS